MVANKEGTFAPPPDGAPYQVTTPGSEAATPDQIAKARANERELAPLVFKAPRMSSLTDQIAAAAKAVASQTAKPIISSMKGVDIPLKKAPRGPASAIILTDPLPAVSRETVVADTINIESGARAGDAAEYTNQAVTIPYEDSDFSIPTPLPPPEPHQKAASDTDSPSRGVPKPVEDKGKQITGGFGDLGEAQYFPLDGSELRELVYGLMDNIHARLKDDLRFSMAMTYPRVTARVVVEIQGYANDQSFQVVKVMPPHTKTPLDIARQHGDEISFIVLAEKVEMTDGGESVAPPNAIRKELGLEAPRKQMVETPTGRMFVDVKS